MLVLDHLVLGPALPLQGHLCFGFLVPPSELRPAGFCLSLRGHCRSGPSLSVYSVSRLGLPSLVLDFSHMGSLTVLRSSSRPESALPMLDVARLSLLAPLHVLARLDALTVALDFQHLDRRSSGCLASASA